MQAAIISGAFSDPVLDAQAAFRALMDAMAEPGTIRRVQAQAVPPAPLSSVAGAVALTLCDHDTPVWLDGRLSAAPDVAAWFGFNTGAPVVNDPAGAQFAFVAAPSGLASLHGFAQGTQEFPDRSVTVVLQVDTLEGGAPLVLSGPGIRERARFAPDPMPAGFVELWNANRALFPRGVDLILAAPGALACLPRTTRISIGEG